MTSRVNTRFQLSDLTWILELNISTQLEYSSQEFWLESSLDESKTRLDLNDSTWCNQFNCCKFEKRSVFVKVVTESNILIFCFISMFDDSFDFKSFTVDVILSSLEKIFRFLALINTEVTNITFINESLMSELCECFDIQSISLLKSKSILLFDVFYDLISI